MILIYIRIPVIKNLFKNYAYYAVVSLATKKQCLKQSITDKTYLRTKWCH
jgi:hypothetical protein